MDRNTIFSKTAKGLSEASGKTSLLPRDQRNVLKEVDGRTSVGQLQQKLEKIPEPKLIEMLTKFESDGFVRDTGTGRAAVAPASVTKPVSLEGEDLDFTSPSPPRFSAPSPPSAAAQETARRAAEAEAKAKAEAAARARAEAAVKAKLEALRSSVPSTSEMPTTQKD